MYVERQGQFLQPWRESKREKDIIALYKYLMGGSNEGRSSVLKAHYGRTRENGHELKHEKSWLYTRKNVFIMGLVQHCNRGPDKLWPCWSFFRLCFFPSTPQGSQLSCFNNSRLLLATISPESQMFPLLSCDGTRSLHMTWNVPYGKMGSSLP